MYKTHRAVQLAGKMLSYKVFRNYSSLTNFELNTYFNFSVTSAFSFCFSCVMNIALPLLLEPIIVYCSGINFILQYSFYVKRVK